MFFWPIVYSFTMNTIVTLVSIAKLWFICGYHGLTTVMMIFLVLFVVKLWLILGKYWAKYIQKKHTN